MNSSRVMRPFSIKSFASASVCARLETRSSSNVTGLLSGSAFGFFLIITGSAIANTFGGIVKPICLAVFTIDNQFKPGRILDRQLLRVLSL